MVSNGPPSKLEIIGGLTRMASITTPPNVSGTREGATPEHGPCPDLLDEPIRDVGQGP